MVSVKALGLLRMYPGFQAEPALNVILIPKQRTVWAGGRDLQNAELLHPDGNAKERFRAVGLSPVGILCRNNAV